MESGSFKEFMDMQDKEGPFLGDLIYPKVKEAILENYDTAFLFTLIPTDNEDYPDGIVFSLDREQFHIFLDNYLKMCEEKELYERCIEILDLQELITDH
jgi:hypothetical protein